MMKNMLQVRLVFLLSWLALLGSCATKQTVMIDGAGLGLTPNTGENQSALMQKAIDSIRSVVADDVEIVFNLPEGRYDFYPTDAAQREYYISNHDQTNPKIVGLPFEDFKNFTFNGNGAQLVFHGRMLPMSVLRSTNVTLKNFSIDFENPHISQVEIVANDTEKGISFKPAPWVKYRITEAGMFEVYGEGWSQCPQWGIAFDGATRHIVYTTSDVHCPISNVQDLGDGILLAPNWKDARLKPGTVMALRGWGRPTPGIFLSHNEGTKILNVKVHYSEGMALLAQLCEDITLDGFGVCLKGDDDPRYFTSQADATHFSGCKGKIISINGLYEGMMDDAINVHGTYLKVVKRVDDYTLEGKYMHGQAWGFDWGYPGDRVQFVRSQTMELIGEENEVVSIEPVDKPTVHGASTFRIRFKQPVADEITAQKGYGIENLTWTPEVYFAHNTIRNNRARGALFSTPQPVVVEENLFDHTSGCAILLCGDCNGWYETGACRDVVIRKNRFINALTSQFQFTNAVISIYPEIPNLNDQEALFHGGKDNAIRIVDNVFETFDAPILYAKSVDGLLFEGNDIIQNTDFKPMHWNRYRFFLQRVKNVKIEGVLVDRLNILPDVKLVPVNQ